MTEQEIKKIEKEQGKHFAGALAFLSNPQHHYLDNFSIKDLFYAFFSAREHDLDAENMFEFICNRIKKTDDLDELIELMKDDFFSEICAWQRMIHENVYWEVVMNRAVELVDTVDGIMMLKRFQGSSEFHNVNYERKRSAVFRKFLEKYKNNGSAQDIYGLRGIVNNVFGFEKKDLNEAIFEKIKENKVELAAVIAKNKYELGDEYREKAREALGIIRKK